MRSIFLLLLIIAPAYALSIQVSGDCVNQKILISTDEPSLLVLRMNYGVPIYASTYEGSAVFVPRVSGELLITAISEKGEVSKIVKVKECTKSGDTKISANILPDGTFDEQGHKINWRTAYGALRKACEILGYSYTSKMTDWGIFVDCIRGVCTGSLGKTSGWMYWVNYPTKPMPGIPATDYRVYPKDEILWYFSRSMDEKPEDSLYSLRIYLGSNYEMQVSVKWETSLPPVADFDFSPSIPYVGQEVVLNASKSFALGGKKIVEYLWEIEGKELRGKVFTYKFEKEGEYEVKLTVFDEEGLYSSVLKLIKVVKAEGYGNFTVEGERVIDLGFGFLRIRAEKAEVSLKNESCRFPYHDVKLCFSLWSNESILASFESNEKFKIFDLVRDRWVIVKEDGNFKANISTGKFAVLTQWKDFPLYEKDERIKKALEYLRGLQRDDGGFGEEKSLFSATCWAIMAIVSANENLEDWKKGGRSPVDYLKQNIKEEIAKMGTADIARAILAIVYAGEDPRDFEGYDLVKMLKERLKDNGQIGDYVYTTIWGSLALKSAGEDISKSLEWLRSVQNPDGGFSWIEGEKSDCDDTSAAIQLLILAKDYQALNSAVEYLKTCQNPDGGIKYFGESASNSASDSWAIQALVAAGENPVNFKRNNISVVDHLLSLQSEEGFFKYTAYEVSNPGYMTASALMALLGKFHPIISLPIYTTTLTVRNETTLVMPIEIFSETGIDELTLITKEIENLTLRIEKLKEVPEAIKLDNAVLHLSINVTPSNVSAYIKFAVPKDEKSYILMKFDGNNWIRLKTEYLGYDDGYRYYRAFTQSFSYFALVEEKNVTQIPSTTPLEKTTAFTAPETPITPELSKESAEPTKSFELVIAIAGVVALFLIFVYHRLRK